MGRNAEPDKFSPRSSFISSFAGVYVSRNSPRCKKKQFVPSDIPVVDSSRVIRLPKHMLGIPVVDGIPDLLSTRCINFAMALFCLIGFLGVAVALVMDNRIQWTVELGIVVGVLILLMAGSAIALTREGLKAGAWFRIDEVGLSYGTGTLSEGDVLSTGERINWDEIVHKPNAGCDVRTEYRTYRSFTKNFVLWRRLATGEIVEHRIPMRLTSNIERCVRFKNHDALTVAILRGLASQSSLRFDLDVFVDAGVNPETWMPMKRPRWMAKCSYALSSLLGVLFVMQFVLTLSIWMTIGGMLAVSAIASLLGNALWKGCYRDLTGIVRFDGHE
ncbi:MULTISPECIES: hypothetical protein [unclassified Burkholderia]|uniref:hypothetical protein n=1 Tax=unclassified Burkholderia TaxID=2613784 RepID=UPI0012E346CB|nr:MULTISPECIES: hypothetical protein [unclassified Burkholderia]